MGLLHENIDEVAKEMLSGVIEKKQKVERLKAIVKLLKIITFLGFSLFSVYVVLFIVYPNELMLETVFSQFLSHHEHLYILLVLFSMYWGLLYYQNKCESAENEFHALRCEIIQKSADLWKDEKQWNERHKLFEMMKKEYDINLYYENK